MTVNAEPGWGVAASSAAPRFDPRFVVEHVEGVGTFLLSEDASLVLTQPAQRAVAPLLDGVRTSDDIVARVASEVSAVEAYHALELLARDGYLADDAPGTDDGTAAHWRLAGVEPSRAASRLVTNAVRVIGHSVDATSLRAAVERAGVAVTDTTEAALDVLAVDDYLDAALAEHNELALATGRPWLLVKPAGAVVWIGPLFVPGQTGCWACLAQRLEGNRAIESYLVQQRGAPVDNPGARARHPASAEMAYAVAAQQVAHFVAGVEPVPLAGSVWSLDTRTLATTEHTLTRRPQCPRCGDGDLVRRVGSCTPVLESRRRADDTAHRAASLEETYERVLPHVSPITGAVKSVDRVWSGTGETLHAYTAGHNFAVQYDGLAFLRKSLRVRSGGKGRTDLEARLGAMCEAIERYSGVYRGEEAVEHGSYEQLAPIAIHPNDVMLFSDHQLDNRGELNERNRLHTFSSQLVPRRFDPNAAIDWTPIWSLRDGTRRLLPTGMCYFNYASFKGYRSATDLYFIADSNGHAAGASFEDAVLQGFLELVERDAVGIWWYNRLRRPAVDLDSFSDAYIPRIRERLDAMDRDVWALDLTNDVGIPVVCAASRRRSGSSEELVFGFGAHLDPEIAVVRALTELAQFLASFEKWGEGPNRYVAFDEVAASWWRTATLESEPYFRALDGRVVVNGSYETRGDADLLVEIEECVRRTEAVGIESYVLDQTRPDIGVPVAKVVAPGLRHMWSRLGPGRLYDVPARLGWVDRPTPEEELNPWAVFF